MRPRSGARARGPRAHFLAFEHALFQSNLTVNNFGRLESTI
jgi:hypothetical protein